jgi:hypothetical protein
MPYKASDIELMAVHSFALLLPCHCPFWCKNAGLKYGKMACLYMCKFQARMERAITVR